MRELRGDGGQGGGGSFRKMQKEPVGSSVKGGFVEFRKRVPSGNPAYPPQDIVTLNVDGSNVNIPCPAALSRVFTNNTIEPGTLLEVTYQGKQKGKNGKEFHSFKVVEVEGSTSFPADGTKEVPGPAPVADIDAQLAAARARRAQQQTA